MSFEQSKFLCAAGLLLISLGSTFSLGAIAIFFALTATDVCACEAGAKQSPRSQQLFLLLLGAVCMLPGFLGWWFVSKWNEYMRKSPATYRPGESAPRRRFQMNFENGVLKP